MIKLKAVFAVLLIALLIKNVSAQTSMGLQGGWNSAAFHLSPKSEDVTIKNRNGLIIGAVINFKLNKIFSYQIEPRYIQKGEKTEFASTSSKGDVMNEYLEIPVCIIAEYPGSTVKPFLLAGVNFGGLLSNKLTYENNGTSETYDTMSDYKYIDIALDFGGGIKYSISPKIDLVLSGRYSLGLSNISNMQGDMTTRGVQALAGVLYNF